MEAVHSGQMEGLDLDVRPVISPEGICPEPLDRKMCV